MFLIYINIMNSNNKIEGNFSAGYAAIDHHIIAPVINECDTENLRV